MPIQARVQANDVVEERERSSTDVWQGGNFSSRITKAEKIPGISCSRRR